MKKLRVLFVGNSHTFFNDMPAIFKKLAEAGQDVEVEATMQAHPGVTYAWHLSQGAELRYALVHGNYDYMVMQQAAHSPCPEPEETIRDGKELIRLARLCGTEPIICLPWAERHFPEHQAQMYKTYTTLAEETGTKYNPIGHVFERVLKERPDIDMYWFDGEHCSPYGSYTNAAATYANIFGVSPEGLPAVSIKHNIGNAEDFAVLKAIGAELASNPDKRDELVAKYKKASGELFAPIWAEKDVWIDLDPEKVATLQKWIWEYVQAQ